jgi:hypothetical protein
MIDQMKRDIKRGASTAKEHIGRIAASVKLRPEKARNELVKIVDQMDVPSYWSDERKLQWAIANIERVQQFVERKR